ncbi:hypothetical protein AVEN_264347-1 [Araneus ventricosus]|uniref:Endonuclease/exonuclease/phosphatase domain-containing protein n=1 Tax=Araneus ventricosus TaxID=182803 RepID=A0A4Y2H635_ARAVE|nr:hypothetical protein AVEN_264347-1 [Araneus ventricosus]
MGPLKQPALSGHSVNNFDTFIIKRVSEQNENFSNVSPFLVEKAITGGVGTVTSTKLMRSGDLLVEVASLKQAQQILKINSLSTISISVQPHITLNSSKGVITCGRLLNLSNEEITQELGGQGVKDVRRINMRRDGELLPTKHFILTFNTPRLSEYIKAGYVLCSVRPYIPDPLSLAKNGSCAIKPQTTNQPTSAPEASNTAKNRARSKSEKSQKLKQAKRGLSQKDLPAKLKKSAHYNSVALGLADKGIAHKDLPSIFGGVPQVPDLELHPSDEDEDLQMNCDASETPPCVPTSNPPTLLMGSFLSWNCRGIRSKLQDLKGLITIFNPVCIGLQETFLSSNNPLKLRGYNSVRKDTATGSNHSGGVCILTSNLYPSTPLTLHTSLQAVAVRVHTQSLVTV